VSFYRVLADIENLPDFLIAPAFKGAANILFALISCHHDSTRFCVSPSRQLIFLWHPHVEQKNIGRKLMIEFRVLLGISSFTERLNVFLFQNRNQLLSNDRMISGERAPI
jgi:hypothetical protein